MIVSINKETFINIHTLNRLLFDNIVCKFLSVAQSDPSLNAEEGNLSGLYFEMFIVVDCRRYNSGGESERRCIFDDCL